MDDDTPYHGIVWFPRVIRNSGAMKNSVALASPITDAEDVGLQMHSLEREAYNAVLRAFCAQSDVLSWCKEELLTELRKELRVSDVEHREILLKVSKDESIKSLRELDMVNQSHMTEVEPNFYPYTVFSGKKLKTGHVSASAAPNCPPCAQQPPASVSTSLVKNYRDDRRGGNALSHLVNIGVAPSLVHQGRQLPSTRKAEVPVIWTSKSFVPARAGNLKPGSDIIKIPPTDKLIREVEKFCGGKNPNSANVEAAKMVLKDHEKNILDALGKLADVSDGDDSLGEQQHLYGFEAQMNGRRYVY